MLGKTTMSSRGTSRRRIVFSARSRFSLSYGCHSWFRNCTDRGKGCAESRLDQPSMRRNRCSASAATRPARRSDESATPYEPPRHHAGDEDAASPEDEPGVVARVEIQPALWRTSTPRSARRRSSFGLSRTWASEPEEVAGVGRRQAGLRRREAARCLAEASQSARQSEVMSQAVVYLPTPKAGCLVDAKRDPRSTSVRDLVAAVHERVGEPERAHQRVDAIRAGARRAPRARRGARSPPRRRTG